ncbi:MAG: ATP-binding cassette domain-containing protein [Ruminococcaceae bacterium]|nr:ATP-binding cassette domain-containing protein [Oscillospiraceae bacterium]
MLKVHNLSVKYGDHTVLQDLSASFPEQGVTALIGPSGVGKTTLFRVLSGLLKPTEGSVTSTYQKPAYLFQEPRLFPWMNALENVSVVCGDKQKAQALLTELLPQEDALLKYPHELSGGMKQRVSIARALAYDPDILFMDEPFKGLDEATKASAARFIFEKTKDIPVFFITHDKEDLPYCDTVYRICAAPVTTLILEKSSKSPVE